MNFLWLQKSGKWKSVEANRVRDTRPVPHVPRSRSCLIPKKIDSLPSSAAFERRRRWEARRGWNFMKGCNKKSWSKRWDDERESCRETSHALEEDPSYWCCGWSGYFSCRHPLSQVSCFPDIILCRNCGKMQCPFSLSEEESEKKVLRFEFSDLQKLIDEIQWCSIDRQLFYTQYIHTEWAAGGELYLEAADDHNRLTHHNTAKRADVFVSLSGTRDDDLSVW